MTAGRLIPLGIICSTAVFYAVVERRRPYNRQPFFREGFFTDFFWYTIVQSFVLGFAITGFVQWLDGVTGLSRLQWVTTWPLWLQMLFFLLVHDFYIYWFHRWQHSNKYLWRVHEAHHSVKEVDWVAGSRSHVLEIAINQTVEFAPIVLLGASPFVWVFKGIIDAVWGMYIHSNINVRSGWLQRIINGPEMHRWHHAVDVMDTNFATKFAFWDWIFGTAYLPSSKPSGYGLVGGERSRFPGNYFLQQVFAFRRFDNESATTGRESRAHHETAPDDKSLPAT